jgi:hypothetical protein
LKTSDSARGRGFESHPFRHRKEILIRRSTQVGRRGAPAKGVGRESGARVRIPPSPPFFYCSAPVAQLDRVSDYESEGREFESRRAHQK